MTELIGSSSSKQEFKKNIVPYMDEIFGAAVRLTEGKLAAEGLAERSFINAWENYSLFQNGTSIRIWLYRVMTRELRENNQQRARTFIKNESILDPPQNQVFLFNPIELDMDTITETDVLSALRTLPERFRETLILGDFQKLSHEEITQALTIPLETVRSRLNVGRHYFQNALWLKTQESTSNNLQHPQPLHGTNSRTILKH